MIKKLTKNLIIFFDLLIGGWGDRETWKFQKEMIVLERITT